MNIKLPFKVKCVDDDSSSLTLGKEYEVITVEGGFYKVRNDCGITWWYYDSRFEIVETPPKDKQEFSVGDKVYKYGETDVKTILEVFKDGYMNLSNYPHLANHESICHATQENYELLTKLYPHIEFELPHKEITGSDLCRAMLDKGWHLVPCVVSDISDSDALNNDNCCLVDEWWVGSFDSCFNSGDYSYKYAVPFDPKTGIPLTEDVLNDIN